MFAATRTRYINTILRRSGTYTHFIFKFHSSHLTGLLIKKKNSLHFSELFL